MFERALYSQSQFFIRPRLRNVAINMAAVDGFDQRVDFRITGENDAKHSRTQRDSFLKQLNSSHFRHPLISN